MRALITTNTRRWEIAEGGAGMAGAAVSLIDPLFLLSPSLIPHRI
jgi:hypothetical protein